MKARVLVKDVTGSRDGKRKVKRLAEEALSTLGLKDREVSVLLTGNGGIRELNRLYRKVDRPTDVLSFPMEDQQMLGDVVISIERVYAQAGDYGVTPGEELSRVLVHGILHLLGYDHVTGGRQARRMREKEAELMTGLKKKGCF